MAPEKPFISISGNETLWLWESCQWQRDKYLVIFVNDSSSSRDVGGCFWKKKIPFYSYQMRIVGFSKCCDDFLRQNVPQQRKNEAGTKGVRVLLILAQP